MLSSYHGWRTDLILVRYKEVHILYRSLKMKIRSKGKLGLSVDSKDLHLKNRYDRCRREMREVLKFRGISNLKQTLRNPAALVWSCPLEITK